MDVYEGRMLPCGEVESLKVVTEEVAASAAEGAEGEDH